MQIIEQTHDETVAMYMKSCTKKEIAEMLANCNEILGSKPPKFDHVWEGNYISPDADDPSPT